MSMTVLVQALVREADDVQDASLQRSLLLRAADVAALRLNDADTAMSLIGRVLSRSPGDPLALRAAWRVNQKTGRHEQALEHLRVLLKAHASRDRVHSRFAWRWRCCSRSRLHRPHDAVKAYRDAATHDPENPVPQIEIPRILLGLGEYGKAAEALGALASQASNPYQRARLLVQAADLHDERLDDLEAAVIALTQAHALVPADAAIFERLVRVQERRGKTSELVSLYERRVEASPESERLALRGPPGRRARART